MRPFFDAWQFWAVLSAVFAALTVGVEQISS
jgi:uncharacterized membrane protein